MKRRATLITLGAVASGLIAHKYEFVVNLRTARMLGMKIAEPILVRADRVIE